MNGLRALNLIALSSAVLFLAGCSSNTIRPGASESTLSVGASPTGPGPAWKYPEIRRASTINDWSSSYVGCGSTVPGQQSPIMIVPRLAQPAPNTLDGLSPTTYSMALTAQSVPNSWQFDVTGTAPTMMFTVRPFLDSNHSGTFKITPNAFHLHAPAEHIFYGEAPAPMEMHITTTGVNVANPSSAYIMVFAVRFQMNSGISSSAMKAVADALAGQSANFDLGYFLNLFQTSPLYSYVGGLTTPPCADPTKPPVTWFLLKDALSIDVVSLTSITAALEKAAGGPNARLPQMYPTSGAKALLVVSFGGQ